MSNLYQFIKSNLLNRFILLIWRLNELCKTQRHIKKIFILLLFSSFLMFLVIGANSKICVSILEDEDSLSYFSLRIVREGVDYSALAKKLIEEIGLEPVAILNSLTQNSSRDLIHDVDVVIKMISSSDPFVKMAGLMTFDSFPEPIRGLLSEIQKLELSKLAGEKFELAARWLEEALDRLIDDSVTKEKFLMMAAIVEKAIYNPESKYVGTSTAAMIDYEPLYYFSGWKLLKEDFPLRVLSPVFSKEVSSTIFDYEFFKNFLQKMKAEKGGYYTIPDFCQELSVVGVLYDIWKGFGKGYEEGEVHYSSEVTSQAKKNLEELIAWSKEQP